MRILQRALIFLGFSLCLGSVSAGVEPYVDLGQKGGVVLGCSNPDRVLQIHRSVDSTEVIQTGRNGRNWQVRLPPTRSEHLRRFLSPQGDAAVVVTSIRDGEAFLVSGKGEKTIVDSGFIESVDFEGDHALVVSSAIVGGRATSSKRVRVYDTRSGEILVDLVKDAEPEGVRTLERDWHFQLSSDGRAFYQVRWWRSAGANVAMVDIAGGRESRYPLTMKDGSAFMGQVYDAVFPSPRRGFVAANSDLFMLDRSGLEAIEVPAELGPVEHLRYSGKQGQVAVIGSHGWGVLDVADNRRITVVESPGLTGTNDVRPADGAWAAVHGKGVRVFKVSGGRPRLLRTVTVDDGHTIACANAYGVIQRNGSSYDWKPAAMPQD